mgnify:CR=1 FL=1
MAVIVKGEITITKGFNHWKEMVFSQKEKMAGMGMQFLFAGTTKEDPTKLIAVMKFDSVEAMQAFGSDEELTETLTILDVDNPKTPKYMKDLDDLEQKDVR